SLDALDEVRLPADADRAHGPGAQQRLVQEVLLVLVGRRLTVDSRLLSAVEPMPGTDSRPPLISDFREHVDPGPHVLAALGVVGRENGQRRWPPRRPLEATAVELVEAGAEDVGMPAHLVQRDQAVI